MVMTGTAQMLTTLSGGGVRVQARPAGVVPVTSSNNAINCDPVVNLAVSDMIKLPFWFFGVYQTLFFGPSYAATPGIMKYIDTTFRNSLGSSYIPVSGGSAGLFLESVMDFLKSKTVPNAAMYTTVPWSIISASGNTITSLIDLANEEIVNDAVVPARFENFEFTKTDVPYYIMWKPNTTDDDSFMKKYKVPFYAYYQYFKQLLIHFTRVSANAFVEVGAFADDDAKSILNLNPTGGMFDDPTKKIYADHPDYLQCRPTKTFLHIGLMNIASNTGQPLSTAILDSENQNYVQHCADYAPSHPFGKPTVTNPAVELMRKIIKRNKLEIIVILLKEVDVPTDTDAATFNALLDMMTGRTRGERFLILFYLLNLDYS